MSDHPPETSPVVDEAAAAALLDAMAPLLGIPVDPAWRGAVIANLKVLSEAARLVHEIPLPNWLEPAPVFRA